MAGCFVNAELSSPGVGRFECDLSVVAHHVGSIRGDIFRSERGGEARRLTGSVLIRSSPF